MSVAYHYLNSDKRQFFDCGLFGYGSRFSAIGRGPGARALALLLSERGAWRNDRIAVIGDTSKDFEEIQSNGVDIEVEVELMLLEVDGMDWVEELVEDGTLAFTRMCAFAIHLRHSNVIRMLDRKFGVGKWQRAYEKHLKGSTDFWSQKVIDASRRRIQLLM